MDEQGRFTDEGYVRVASERWDRQFDGELDDIPDEYRITGSGEAAERDSTIAVLIVEPGKGMELFSIRIRRTFQLVSTAQESIHQKQIRFLNRFHTRYTYKCYLCEHQDHILVS